MIEYEARTKKVMVTREAINYASEQVKSSTPRFEVISQLTHQQNLLEEQTNKLNQQSQANQQHVTNLNSEIESRLRGRLERMHKTDLLSA